ncbi:MAG TPA: M28 family peptidase [Vicinamibacterales bacterium]|nr:M28 family peptidase [Vicinamibacterales bacterium]
MQARRAFAAGIFVLVLVTASRAAAPDAGLIRADDMREWLSYIASDELDGRGSYAPGLGLAAAYIEDHLKAWQIAPAGDQGTYRQTVYVNEVKATSRSTVTVRVGSETRTFRDGDGVVIAPQAGGSRRFTIDRVEFAGYGLDAPAENHADFRGKDVRGALVVWLGADGPQNIDSQRARRVLDGRARHILEDLHANAALTEGVSSRPFTSGSDAEVVPDFVTAERLDKPVAPAATAGPAMLEFLLRGAQMQFAELKRRADARQPLPSFRLADVSVTFSIDVTYEIVRTHQTTNVIGVVRGSDPVLADSYVAFGAHYDHVGAAQPGTGGAAQPPMFGRATADVATDRVWNGADDDGSGTVALMSIARAFAEGERPRRSLLLVWHAGEEIGVHGSHYFVDHPTVPVDRIVAQLNIDMVGRNRDDKPSESDTLYLVGSDRISSELDDISRQANRGLTAPLFLNDEMNDPSDPEQLYYRSDHYSYAAEGIPVIFFTTGLHPDYHTNTDDVSRILFDKLTRVTELVYRTGALLADLDHAPVRDNRGPKRSR